MGHLAFVSKRLSAVGNKRISQIVSRFFDSAPRFSKCAAFTSHSTWVLRLLSLNFIAISSAVARGGAGGPVPPLSFFLKSKNRPV